MHGPRAPGVEETKNRRSLMKMKTLGRWKSGLRRLAKALDVAAWQKDWHGRFHGVV